MYKNIVKWFNDRKDWDVWNTRRTNVPQLFSNQSIKGKSTRKHADHITNSDSGSNTNGNKKDVVHKRSRSSNIDMSKSFKSDRDTIISILDEDNDDNNSEIFSIDENNLNIFDTVSSDGTSKYKRFVL